MSLQDIAAVIIVRDAAETLGRTLASLEQFDEIVVYDNGSSDGSQELARSFANVTLVEGTFTGFGPTKNHAASLAARDWIFSLDADEAVSDELLASLKGADLGDGNRVFEVCRRNYFMGKAVERGGWQRDWLVRLYNKKGTHFTDTQVHEKVIVSQGMRVARLSGFLDHDAVREIRQMISKINRYSEIYRYDYKRRPGPAATMLRTAWAFIRSYVLQLGFLAGWRGLVIAVSEANGTFYKYMKVYADSTPEVRNLEKKTR